MKHNNCVLDALKDNMFLAICILMSVSTIMSISSGGLPLFNILFSVFLWLVYVSARKDVVNANQLRNISGVLYAKIVIGYIAAFMMFIMGIFTGAMVGLANVDSKGVEKAQEIFASTIPRLIDITKWSLETLGIMVVVISTIYSISLFLINWLCIEKIHKFTKSVYQSGQRGVVDSKYIVPTKNCLLVFGILNAVWVVVSVILYRNSIISFISEGCNTAMMILLSVLINKVFLSEKQTNK